MKDDKKEKDYEFPPFAYVRTSGVRSDRGSQGQVKGHAGLHSEERCLLASLKEGLSDGPIVTLSKKNRNSETIEQ